MNPEEILAPLIAAAESAVPRKDGDYIKDGLLHCGRCHTPKQCTVTMPGIDTSLTVSCMCKCMQDDYEREKAERARRDRLAEIRRLRIMGIDDARARDRRFADADMTPALVKCKRYAENWPEMRKKNIGLLMFGDVGTGKSFAAACIANAVLEREVPVLYTNVPKIINSLTGMYKEERISYIGSLNQFGLVVIDDLGVERDTEFGMEILFEIIDTRSKSNAPLIVTTNLSLDALKNPNDLRLKRIYDRILGMCIPIKFTGSSRREAARKQKTAWAKALLEGSNHES